MKKYIVSIEKSEQVTEDIWKLKRYNLEIKPETTVAEILKWASKFNGGNDYQNEISLSVLETLPDVL